MATDQRTVGHIMNATRETRFTGTAVYFLNGNQQEKAASLTVTFQLENGGLCGSLRFRGHQTWETNFPVEGTFDKLPEPWELKAIARDQLRKSMERASCAYRRVVF